MTQRLEDLRRQLADPCRKLRVKRLDVFGSAAGADFDEQSSDADLLIEFGDLPPADRADASLGFLTEADALLGRCVDLGASGAIRNPYFRKSIEASRELVYAA